MSIQLKTEFTSYQFTTEENYKELKIRFLLQKIHFSNIIATCEILSVYLQQDHTKSYQPIAFKLSGDIRVIPEKILSNSLRTQPSWG